MKRYVIIAACTALGVGCATFPDESTTRALGEQAVARGYPGMPETLTRRAIQDEAQRLCSRTPDATLTSAEAARIVEVSRFSIKYPDSGKLVGDWKLGARLVASGAGKRIRGGRVERVKENGALCSNCHALDPREVNAGTLGPSLIGYGTQRGKTDATVKYTYEKIYNAWTYFPCSNMPRLGAHDFLTPEQITHVVAYLVEPASPVNRR